MFQHIGFPQPCAATLAAHRNYTIIFKELRSSEHEAAFLSNLGNLARWIHGLDHPDAHG
jgi:hypothetical protein